MTNNPAFVDAIIAGAGGGAQNAILAINSIAQYNNFATAVSTIAVAVDALIPPIVPGPSLSQINLMSTICGAVFHSRVSSDINPGTYVDIALDIVALYTSLSASLTNNPNVYPSGAIPVINGTYSARPAASVPGRIYLATDVPFRYYDTGTAWIQLVKWIATTPPPAIATFTPVNITTLSMSQVADSIKVTSDSTAYVNAIQYFKAGPIQMGPGGIWTITLGLCDVNFASKYDSFGLCFDNSPLTGYYGSGVFRSDVLWGFWGRSFSNAPNNMVGTSAATDEKFGQPRDVYWMRYRCDGTRYYLDFSYDGITWYNFKTAFTLSETYVGGYGPCDYPTNWGIGSTYVTAPGANSPMSCTVCHLTNTPTFAPL